MQLSLEDDLRSVALDGKTLCGTLMPHQRAIHLLATLDQKTGCVLSQIPVDAKTNKHTAAVDLLKSMVLEGRVITGDAKFCQRELCQTILDRGGHELITVKENQSTLLREITSAFAETKAFSPWMQQPFEAAQQTAQTRDKGHGRLEHGRLDSTTILNDHLDWPGVAQGRALISCATQIQHHGVSKSV